MSVQPTLSQVVRGKFFLDQMVWDSNNIVDHKGMRV